MRVKKENNSIRSLMNKKTLKEGFSPKSIAENIISAIVQADRDETIDSYCRYKWVDYEVEGDKIVIYYESQESKSADTLEEIKPVVKEFVEDAARIGFKIEIETWERSYPDEIKSYTFKVPKKGNHEKSAVEAYLKKIAKENDFEFRKGTKNVRIFGEEAWFFDFDKDSGLWPIGCYNVDEQNEDIFSNNMDELKEIIEKLIRVENGEDFWDVFEE